MAILKVIEILANSKKSWEDAAQNAVKHAAKSLRNIKSVNVSNMSANVDKKGVIIEFRLNVKISFEVDESGNLVTLSGVSCEACLPMPQSAGTV